MKLLPPGKGLISRKKKKIKKKSAEGQQGSGQSRRSSWEVCKGPFSCVVEGALLLHEAAASWEGCNSREGR